MKILKQTILILLIGLVSNNIHSQEKNIVEDPPPGGCTIYMTPYDYKNVSNTAGSFQIFVRTSEQTCIWTVSKIGSWVTISKTRGTGDGFIDVSYGINNTSSEQTATISVGEESLYLIQAPKDTGYDCEASDPQKTITVSTATFEDDCVVVNGVIQARDQVILDGSFSYSAITDAPLTIRTNPDIICSTDYLTAPTIGDSRVINTSSAEVGTIAGAASVSLSGAATYNIPIEIPQGTAGMQPRISITYSSQQGRSLLGKGFNISGLSAITRVPQDLYHDNSVSGLKIEDKIDRYSLDGNRLLNNGTTYGIPGCEYRTEQNTFAKIISYEILNNRYFTVKTKNGSILEYGNSLDSKLTTGGNYPLAYYLNKVTDINGNYMTYTYEQENGELWIKRIEYTGNVGLNPYNTIHFYYDKREDIKSYFLSGDEIKQQKLLCEIVVKTNDKVLRKYNLKYIKDDLDESCLNEIIESNGAGEEYNSTVINWGNQNLYNISHKTTTLPSNTSVDYDEKIYSSYDVNSDGISDLITLYDTLVSRAGGNRYSAIATKIYTTNINSSGNLTFSEYKSSVIGSNYVTEDYKRIHEGLVFADLAGRGKKDIIAPYFDNTDEKTVYFRVLNSEMRGNNFWTSVCDNEFPHYAVADFDKNGRDNIIIIEDKKVDGYYNGKILEIYNETFSSNGSFSDFQVASIDFKIFTTSKPKAIFTGDYNNDGLIDLRVITDGGIYTYMNINGTLTNNASYTGYSGVNCFEKRQGDFNGDGILDLLIVGNNVESTAVAYGNGDYGVTMSYFSDIIGINDPDTKKDNDEDNVIVTDFNNDGLSDFILFNGKYHWEHDLFTDWKEFTEFKVRWYKSTGTDFVLEKTSISTNHSDAQKERYISGDFNGDGRQDLINYGFEFYNQSSKTTAWRFYNSFNNNFEANKVKTIHNGFNHKTEFSYRPLSYAIKDGNDFYVKGTSSITDVNKYQFPMYVVDVLTQPDGKIGTINTSYSYEGLRAHNKGKGMLGFEKISALNSKTGLKSISYNELDPNYFVVKKQTTDVENASGVLISRNITDFEATPSSIFDKVIFNHPINVSNENKLTGVTITKENFVFDVNGNLTYLDEIYGAIASTKIKNTYFTNAIYPFGKISTSTVTNKYDLEPVDIKTSTYTYDTDGHLKSSISSGITVTNDTFDKFGNVTAQTTSGIGVEPHTGSSTYDATGRFVSTSTNTLDQTSIYNYNELGQLVSETGIDGLTSSYTYNTWGKLKSIKSQLGITTNYSTDWMTNGFFTLEQTTNFPDAKTYFDIYGRKIKTETTGFGGLMYSEIFYNDKGQVEKTISPYFAGSGSSAEHETTYINDEYGRNTSVTNNGLTSSTQYTFGSTVVVETFPSGKTKTSTLNATGKATEIENLGVTMAYKFHSNGQLKDVSGAGSQIDLTYDDNGNRDGLTDPDAGAYSFDYDTYGRLETKSSPISPVGNYSAIFDADGRLESETEDGNTISYSYIASGNGINQIETISDNQGEFQNFNYDEFGRISDMTERVGDLSMAASYVYDEYGREIAINYPEGFGIKYIYDTNSGELVEIQTNNGDPIWKLNEVNEHGQIIRYEYGNGLETVLGYDANNFLRSITTGTVQNLTYTFDAQNVVLLDRTGVIEGTTETFGYDQLNQLVSVATNNKPGLNLSMTYSGSVSGRMEFKSDIGIFDYTSSRPHAVTDIDVASTGYAPEVHEPINYTSFGKVSDITQGNTKVEFIYGSDHQRKMMKVYLDDVLQRKVYYFGNYERHEEAGNVKHIYYIYSANGLSAIYKKETGADSMFYVHKDHLGSIQVITDQNKDVKAQYYYNVWGVKSNIDLANSSDFQPTNDLPWLHRGFTGHEHITEFGYINMNGRVYDPDLGMFLSPDPQLQAPDNPVNFNRYAYCLNNPLVYTDPTGEFWDVILGGIAGGVLNFIYNYDNIDNFWEGAAVFNVGGLAGSLTALTKGADNGFLATTAASITASIVGSTSQAVVNEIVSQTGNGVGIEDVDWGSVGNSALYALGGSLASEAIALDINLDFLSINDQPFSFNLMEGNHALKHTVNHVLRSTAYNVGGNLFTGNAPFEGFDRHFVGIDASIIIPSAVDGALYMANNTNLANRYMTTKKGIERANKEFYAEHGDEIKEKNLEFHEHGFLDSDLYIDHKGNISADGSYNFFNDQYGMYPHFIERRSRFNIGYLFNLHNR